MFLSLYACMFVCIFLWYGGHPQIIIFYDNKSRQTRSVCHIEFDESHYYNSSRPLYAQKMYNIYHTQTEQASMEQQTTQQCLISTATPTPNNDKFDTDVSNVPSVTQETDNHRNIYLNLRSDVHLV